MKQTTEYLTIKTHAHLIGKKARFKQDGRYSRHCWGKTGVIKQLFQVQQGDLDHIGLSLVFDTPMDKYGMESLYIMPDSIEIWRTKNTVVQDRQMRLNN